MFRPAASFRRTWWTLFALLLVGCLAWAIGTPLMASADEGAHAVRAAGVVRGQLLPKRTTIVVEAWIQKVPEAYGESGKAGCFGQTAYFEAPTAEDVLPDCVPQFHGSDRLVKVPTYEFRGSPAYYWAVGLPSIVWPDRPGMIGMRVINAVAMAALLASAFATALHRRGRSFAIVGVLIAVTPMVWYLGGTVNPNGTEIAAAVALWAALLALATEDSRESDGRLIARAGIAAAVLVSTRGLGPGFALMAVVAAALVASPERIRAVLRRRDTRIWSGVTVTLVALTVTWTLIVGLDLAQPDHPAVGLVDAFKTLPIILRQSVGAMGTNFLPLPFAVIAGWVLVAAGGIVAGLVDATNRGRLAIGLTALATVALPLTTDGYNIPNIGFEWQGRYGLPLTVGLLVLSFWLVDARTVRRRSIAAGLVVLALVGHLAAFLAMGRRLGMGRVEGLNVLDWVFRPNWEPGLPPWLLFSAFVLACVGLGVIMIPSLLANDDDPDGAGAAPDPPVGAEIAHG